MKESELIEFVTMLLVENKCNKEEDFCRYFLKNSDRNEFNSRYKILLDKFLNNYALTKTEKSE